MDTLRDGRGAIARGDLTVEAASVTPELEDLVEWLAVAPRAEHDARHPVEPAAADAGAVRRAAADRAPP